MTTAQQIQWTTVFDKTREICEEDENFSNYSVREKMMAFIFTFLQKLQENETQFSGQLHENRLPFINNRFLQELKTYFNSYTSNLLLKEPIPVRFRRGLLLPVIIHHCYGMLSCPYCTFGQMTKAITKKIQM